MPRCPPMVPPAMAPMASPGTTVAPRRPPFPPANPDQAPAGALSWPKAAPRPEAGAGGRWLAAGVTVWRAASCGRGIESGPYGFAR